MNRHSLEDLRRKALDQLREQHKREDLQLAGGEIDEIPSTGSKIFRFAALRASNPAGPPVDIVVDESGKTVDLKSLVRSEAKMFFGGERRPRRQYSYSVKFVCGSQESDSCCCAPGVRPGSYATEINIHNYQHDWAWLEQTVVPLIFAGVGPHGYERAREAKARDWLYLPSGSATMVDCCRLGELLYGSVPAKMPLTVGFLEIVSPIELQVTAVYTATDLETRSVSIDVETVAPKIKYPYWTETPRPVVPPEPVPDPRKK